MCCIMCLSENPTGSSGMNIPWTARPCFYYIIERGWLLYGENIVKDIDFYNYLFDSFLYKSKLVAHTVKCSD